MNPALLKFTHVGYVGSLGLLQSQFKSAATMTGRDVLAGPFKHRKVYSGHREADVVMSSVTTFSLTL